MWWSPEPNDRFFTVILERGQSEAIYHHLCKKNFIGTVAMWLTNFKNAQMCLWTKHNGEIVEPNILHQILGGYIEKRVPWLYKSLRSCEFVNFYRKANCLNFGSPKCLKCHKLKSKIKKHLFYSTVPNCIN